MTPSLGAAIFWRLFGAAAVFFMLSPLLLVIVFSFGTNELATLPLGGLTTQWYADLFANPNFLTALRNSLIVTASVGLISTITGVLAALAFARWRPGAAEGAIMILSLPVMMPPLVLALALATSFSSMKFQLGLHTVIPSHVIFTQPFVILVVYAQLSSFNFAIIDSARDLGASPWHAFRTILLPLVSPAIIGAALLAMAVSLDDFVITFFTIGNGMTLPTLIWGMLRKGLDPSINALGTLILAATIGASALALGLTKYRG